MQIFRKTGTTETKQLTNPKEPIDYLPKLVLILPQNIIAVRTSVRPPAETGAQTSVEHEVRPTVQTSAHSAVQ